MWQRLMKWVKGLFIKKESVEAALGVKLLTTPEEQDAIRRWREAYEGKAPWNDDGTPSLMLARSVCSEVARNVAMELESEVQGNEWLGEQYGRALDGLRGAAEMACALGEAVFRPFVYRDKILVNVAEAGTYYPVRRAADGTLEAAVFVERQRHEGKDYVLLTHCDWSDGTYKVENTAWEAPDEASIGKRVKLGAVESWSGLSPAETFRNTEAPWFSAFAVPGSKSVFDGAMDAIRLADEQDARITWENEAAEMAIDASSDMFKTVGKMDARNPKNSKVSLELPKGKERLFRANNLGGEEFGMSAWTPKIRIDELSKRLDQLKRHIETVVGLSYGTLSEPQAVERTATDVKHGRQRFYVLVSGIQQAAQQSLEALAKAMDEIAAAYGMQSGYSEVTFHWGDSILVTDEEREELFERRMNLMKSLQGIGVVKPEETRAALIEFSEFFHLITPEMAAEAEAGLPEPIDPEF